MMAVDDSTQLILTKCSRLKTRDYRYHPISSIDQLERLISELESENCVGCQSLPSLIGIIQVVIASIDGTTLWKSKSKAYESQTQLAQIACRLFQCLCQFDAGRATSEEGKKIICSILQWLRENTDFRVTTSVSQKLHLAIYACLEYYSLVCQNQEEFLNELFSTSSISISQPFSLASCFTFRHHPKAANQESLSTIDYSVRLLIYLLESALVSSSLLINQILTFFLIYAPIARFSIHLVNDTDFYQAILVPLLSRNNAEYFRKVIIEETAKSQTDSTDRVFVFTHLINLIGEFGLHSGIEISSSSFAFTFNRLFDALVECGTTLPLWYLMKCVGNLLTNANGETHRFAEEINHLGLTKSITQYTSNLIQKSTLADGQMVLKALHNNVFTACLSIFYNVSTLDEHLLDTDKIINELCRPLLKADVQHVRLISCLLYSNLLTRKELESDQSCHHLCDELFSSIRQAFLSTNYHLSNQISLFTLVNCLKNLCVHKQFQSRIGQKEDNIELIFQILRQLHPSCDEQEEIQILLESLWFLSFNYSCARMIHSHDKYFALLVQLAETHPNEMIQQAAKGILWQLRQTISIDDTSQQQQPIPSNSLDHIMFSYNHDSKDLVIEICQYLRQAGYRTWLDVDDMHGSTLDCMARAVEQSSLIIICMTEKYKQSPNCQSEAEYARRLEKPFIPILLQAKYRPNGWLGMLLGTRLYVDFTKHHFDGNCRKLVKEIEATRH